jgi:integrase
MAGATGGQIQNRGKGAWQVRIFLGRDASGKREFHTKTLRGTKADAQKYLVAKLRERDQGVTLDRCSERFDSYLARWLAGRGTLRARTRDDYASIIRRYLAPGLGHRTLSQLSRVELKAFYVRMALPKDEGGYGVGSRTVRYAHAVLHTALAEAVDDKLIPSNPAVGIKLNSEKSKRSRTLTPEQAKTFLDHAQASSWHAFFVVLLDGGLRPSEALALTWDHLEGAKVKIRRVLVERTGKGNPVDFEDPKTEGSVRDVVLSKMAVRALKAHRARQAEEKLKAGVRYKDEGLIFATSLGTPMRQANIYRRHFVPLVKAAGLEDTKLRIYDLRHSCGSLTYADTQNVKLVQERLGHARAAFTMDTYVKGMPGQQQVAADLFDERFG